MHGEHVSVLEFVHLSFFGTNDFVQQDLVLGVYLGEMLLRAMTIGSLVALVQKRHVVRGR